MTAVHAVTLTGEISARDFSRLLPPDHRLRSQGLSTSVLMLLDDFDWHIRQSGGVLLRNEQSEFSLLQADGSALSVAAYEDVRFWWELPSGALAARLKELIDVRALIPRYQVQLRTEEFAVLNEDEKTILCLELQTLTSDSGAAFHALTFLPLRGYEQESSRIESCLAPLMAAGEPNPDLRTMLLRFDGHMVFPESKPRFSLDAHEPAEAAVTRMATAMIEIAVRQEQGIIDDIDSEFVHQYRVNIRKARSLISLFKKSLSSSRYLHLKAELKVLGGRTNALRDLDVFLLDHDYYRDLLPENLQPGFEQLFRRIRRRRVGELKKVCADLTSDAYHQQVEALLDLLRRPPEGTAPEAEMEIRDLAGRKILRQYRRIRKDGGLIDDQTPDEAVHELRIEGKKLRYLLELFADLFPKTEVKILIKQLKLLQDNLGRFNDYSVQQEFLLRSAQGRNITTDQMAGINGLTAILYYQQQQERKQVTANIAGFLDPPVASLFQELFHFSSVEATQQ